METTLGFLTKFSIEIGRGMFFLFAARKICYPDLRLEVLLLLLLLLLLSLFPPYFLSYCSLSSINGGQITLGSRLSFLKFYTKGLRLLRMAENSTSDEPKRISNIDAKKISYNI